MGTTVCHVLLSIVAATLSGCTTASVRGSAGPGGVAEVRIDRVRVDLDRSALEPDRAARLEEIGTAAALQKKLGQYLEEAGFLEGEMGLAVQINAFRLPGGARRLTGSFQGSDFLGADVALARADAVLHHADVRVQLGAGDRSVGATYSADWALDSLIDMLAWEIAWDLTGVAAGGRGEDAVLAAGKRDSVKRAILVLAHRGKLSYGEMLKYAALGKIGVENTALSEKYDVCALRKTATLGLSSCSWDTSYR